MLSATKGQISSYDIFFRKYAAVAGMDWVMMAAQCYQESCFDPKAHSWAGACGLMQIMPATAKSMGYAREALFDVRINVEIAAKLLHENNSMLRLPKEFDATERLRFILACYNAGYSRIADAKRLALYHEERADKWSVVANYLSLLGEEEYAQHEVVQSGAFYGSAETIAYVSKVMHIYNLYRSKITF